MLKIDSTVHTGVQGVSNLDPSATLRPIHGSRFASTLASAKGGGSCNSIFYALAAPFKVLGIFFTGVGNFIKNYILCCCRYTPLEERLDWKATKEIFGKIHTALEMAEYINRDKAFRAGFGDLSKAAHHRFREHVFYAIAERDAKGIDKNDKAALDKWVQGNYEKYDLPKDYFDKLDHPEPLKILRRAAETFKDEINRKI